MAQRKRAGLITRRALDRNQLVLVMFPAISLFLSLFFFLVDTPPYAPQTQGLGNGVKRFFFGFEFFFPFLCKITNLCFPGGGIKGEKWKKGEKVWGGVSARKGVFGGVKTTVCCTRKRNGFWGGERTGMLHKKDVAQKKRTPKTGGEKHQTTVCCTRKRTVFGGWKGGMLHKTETFSFRIYLYTFKLSCWLACTACTTRWTCLLRCRCAKSQRSRNVGMIFMWELRLIVAAMAYC